MAPHSSRYLLGWALLCCIVTAVTSTDRTICMTCSYTGGDVGQECINASYPYSNSSCRQGCITTANYTAGYCTLKSVERECRVVEAKKPETGVVMCNDSIPQCWKICNTELCNNGVGDLYNGSRTCGVASLDLQMALWLLTGGAVLSCL